MLSVDSHEPPTDRPALRAPLVPVALGMAAGILTDAHWPVPATACLGAFVLAGTALVLARRRWHFRLLTLGIAAAAVGAMMHEAAFRRVPERHVIRYTDRVPRFARIRGTIRTKPILNTPKVNDFKFWLQGKYRTKFVIEAHALDGVNGPIDVTGLVFVHVAAPHLGLQVGDEIEAFGSLYRERPPDNPGQRDWKKFQRRRGILLGLSCNHAEAVRVLRSRAGTAWQRLVQALRQRAHAMLLDQTATNDPESASLLQAMILGQRSQTTRAIDEAFIRTGAVHFLSVSGMHVGMLCVFAWWLGRLLGLDRRAAAWIVLAMVTVYLLIAEPRPPVLRASVAAAIFCFSVIGGRTVNSANWIAAAAIVVLALRPTELFQPGFQLSFGVLLAVVFLSPKVRETFRRVVLRRSPEVDRLTVPPDQAGPYHRLTRRVPRWLGWYLAVSVAAWMVGAPLAMVHFQRASVWGWINTPVMLPVVFVVMVVGFTKLLAAAILPSSATLFAPLLAWPTKLLAGLAKALAHLPFASVSCAAPPIYLAAGYVAMLTLWVNRRRLGLSRHWPAHAAIVVLIGVSWWLGPSAQRRAGLSVWVLSVDDGSATVIELPNGKCLLYDAGTLGGWDLGSVKLVPALRHQRVNRIDAVLISHPNTDHFSGLLSTHEYVPIERVIVSSHFAPLSPPGRPSRLLLDRLREHNVPIDELRAGDRIRGTGEVQFEVLWPPDVHQSPPLDPNDSSIVLRLSYAGRSILLPGDVEARPQEELLRRGGLHADVLVLPHHGSVEPTTAAFIQAVNPRYVIRSSVVRNERTFSGINELVADRTYFNTADDGAVQIRIEQGELSVWSFESDRRGQIP